MSSLGYWGQWLDRFFGDEERLVMFIWLIAGLLFLVYFGGVLAPFFIALIFAFVFQGLINGLVRIGIPRLLAVWAAFLVFISVMLTLLFLLMPLLVRQANVLVANLPQIFLVSREWLLELPDKYPAVFTTAQVDSWIDFANQQAGEAGTWLLQALLGAIPGLLGLIIYLVLVPILVFFMLRDQKQLRETFMALLPSRRSLLVRIGHEVNRQFANYVRGKVIEIGIVGGCSYLLFTAFGLDYAVLLAALVGLSVLFPFVGAAVVTLPILVAAFSQWGASAHTLWLMVAYGVLQALDGNLLVPILFSNAVSMHPVTIVLAVLFFGGVWGFWGLFFAIPLAILIKSVHGAWLYSKMEPPSGRDAGPAGRDSSAALPGQDTGS